QGAEIKIGVEPQQREGEPVLPARLPVTGAGIATEASQKRLHIRFKSDQFRRLGRGQRLRGTEPDCQQQLKSGRCWYDSRHESRPSLERFSSDVGMFTSQGFGGGHCSGGEKIVS